MLVSDIMHAKVRTAGAEDTFADVAKVMRSNGISSVVVLEKGKKLAGIVTERDIVNLVAAGGDPHSVKVAHGMTRRGLETVGPKVDIAEAADKMVSLNIRHLPVVDRGKVVGIGSIPGPDEMGRRGAQRRTRDARHRQVPEGAPRGERAPEATPDERLRPAQPSVRSGRGAVVARGAAEGLARMLEGAELRDVAREQERHGPIEGDPHLPTQRRHVEQVVRAVQDQAAKPFTRIPIGSATPS